MGGSSNMRSIFFRIYMGILLAIFMITIVVTLSSYYLSKYRVTQHVYKNYSGTFQLIGEGVSRHEGEKRQQWISAIERLSNLSFEQNSLAQKLLNDRQVGQLLNDRFYYQVDSSLSSSTAYILLPENQEYLSVQLSDFGSSLIRISAFLMLNELGRQPKELRGKSLEHLRTLFNYPIGLRKLDSLNINSTQLRTIKKGDIAVELTISGARTPTITAYAPLGNSSYALVLGSIPVFEWFPVNIIVSIILLVLIFMAATSFYLVKPLEKRLAVVDKKIEQIGQDKEITIEMPKGFDAIGKLTNTVNNMAKRIHKLIAAQDDMIRAISHELRAPITRIRFRLVQLENHVETTDDIEGIERNLAELETLIDEVLTFSKLKSHKPDLTLSTINASEFFNEIVQKLELANNNIRITIPEGKGANFYADKRYLFRALSNLLINASKYARKNIELGYKLTDQSQTLWVADDGPGIPISEREDIFTPFKRLDASRDRKSGGYGLGLAIVKQVAQWHGGDVIIKQSSLGGAKLLFQWPIVNAEISDNRKSL